MKRIKYSLVLILILITVSVGIKVIPKSWKNEFNQNMEVKNGSIHDPKGINDFTQSTNSNSLARKNIYSLEQDRKLEKELIIEQYNRLIDKINIDSVAQSLSSKDELKRLDAVKTLGYLPNNKFVSLIENLLLNDPSPEVRRQCAKSLQLLESKNSIPSLILALKDQDKNVRIFATLALAALGEKEESSVSVNSLWNNGGQDVPFYSCHLAFRDLATKDAINKLIFDLNNPDKFIAVDAAIILAQLGQYNEAYPFLEKSLAHSDKYIRMAALQGLAYIGNDNSISLIKSKIKDPNNLVKERAISILKNIDSDQ